MSVLAFCMMHMMSIMYETNDVTHNILQVYHVSFGIFDLRNNNSKKNV